MTDPTPRPWIRLWGAMTVHAPGNDDVLGSQKNIDYAVKCVNAHDDLVAALAIILRVPLDEVAEWARRLIKADAHAVTPWLRDLDAASQQEES